MKTLLFTPLAESDIEQILDFIAEHRPSTAAAVVARIREKCQLVAHHPEIGHRRAEFPGDYHSSTLDRWVIFYRVTEDAVEIHRVLDGSRDIDHLMG
ncbi:MAG: type II toxin-antitoxin system RelE/ParE family toxin [Planctomycetota bacterium]